MSGSPKTSRGITRVKFTHPSDTNGQGLWPQPGICVGGSVSGSRRAQPTGSRPCPPPLCPRRGELLPAASA